MASLRDELLVLLRGQELVPLGLARRLDNEHPSLAVGILVDGLGLLSELAVDLDDLARDRRKEVRHRLDRLDHAKILRRRHLGADLRELDEDDVAELLLRVRRDADADALPFLLGPLVLTRVSEVLGNVRHSFLSPRRPLNRVSSPWGDRRESARSGPPWPGRESPPRARFRQPRAESRRRRSRCTRRPTGRTSPR